MLQHLHDGFAGLHDIGEVEDGQCCQSWPGHQIDLGLGDHAECPLGADHHTRHVERVINEKLVQVVTADPPHDVGVTRLDLLKVVLGDAPDAPVDVRFQAGAAQLGLQFVGIQVPEMGLGTVG